MGNRSSLMASLIGIEDLAKKFVKKPQVFCQACSFCTLPLRFSFISAIVPSLWMYNSLLVFSLFLSVKFNIMLPIFLVSLGTADLMKILVISLSGFAITAGVFYVFSRKLGFSEMKLHEFFVYYFFYSTIWMAIIIIGHIQVIVLRKKVAQAGKLDRRKYKYARLVFFHCFYLSSLGINSIAYLNAVRGIIVLFFTI